MPRVEAGTIFVQNRPKLAVRRRCQEMRQRTSKTDFWYDVGCTSQKSSSKAFEPCRNLFVKHNQSRITIPFSRYIDQHF